MAFSLYTSAFVAILIINIALLTSTSSATPISPLVPRAEEDKISCQTERAPDYYGLGVRLGIYFAWFQNYIANTLLPSEIAGALDTNTIFMITLLIAMIKCSAINMLEQIDGLILMHLSGGTIFGVFSIWGYRTVRYTIEGPSAIKNFGGFGTHARLFLSLAVSIFGLYFWKYAVMGSLVAMGSPGDTSDNDPECGTLYTFMFAKVRAASGIRIFYIFVCICCTIYFGTMLLVAPLAGWMRAKKMIELGKAGKWANSSRLRFATGLKYKELTFLYTWLRWLNLAWLIYSMLLVEFTLNFNNVTNVLGGPNDNELHLPAQLLPLLLGAFGFVRIAWLTFESWRSPDDTSPSIVQDDSETPRRAKTFKRKSDLLWLFSPAMAKEDIQKAEHDADEVDVLEKHKPVAIRYLVSWLPWLSLLESSKSRPAMEKKVSESSVQDHAVVPRKKNPAGV